MYCTVSCNIIEDAQSLKAVGLIGENRAPANIAMSNNAQLPTAKERMRQ